MPDNTSPIHFLFRSVAGKNSLQSKIKIFSYRKVIKNRILTINQIIESENKFISKFSQGEILKIAGKRIADYLEDNFHKYQIFFICGRGNNGNDGIEASKILTKKKN